MTSSILSDLRAALIAKRAELRGPTREDIEIARFADPFDQVSADQLREQAEGEASRVDARVKEIDAALRRIKDGSYGECEECSEPIAERRLKAIPEARLCISCAEEVERRK